jgi:acyl carrier protein
VDRKQDATFEGLLRQAVPAISADQPLTPDLDLLALGLNSLRNVELLVNLETAFGVSLPDELLRFQVFATPAKLREVLDQVLAAPVGERA